jgi:Na+-driven multidrug efflux pump
MALFLILSALPGKSVEILAAFTTGLRVESVIFMPAIAFNMANAVVVGNLLGANKRDEAYRGGLITGAMGVTVVSFLAFLVILGAGSITPLLSNNSLVVRETVTYLRISLLSEPFMAWWIALGGALNGAGDTRGVMFNVALTLWLVRIPLSYLWVVVLGFGPVAVWWTMNLSQFLAAILITRRYLKARWLV